MNVAKMNEKPNLHYGNITFDKYRNLRLKIYSELLFNCIKENTKILEIGCYTADLLEFLPKKIEYYGMDFDSGAIEIARKKGAKVINLNFNYEEIKLDSKFDIIICTEVLEHVIDPSQLTRKITNLVESDGYVLFSFPNENTIYHRFMSFIGRGIDMCAFELNKHLHLPTIYQSRYFVSEHFRIIKEKYYINPSAKGSRCEWIGKYLTLVPNVFWLFLARLSPGLFARGVIFLCKKKSLVKIN